MPIRFAGPRSVPDTRLRPGTRPALAARFANDNGLATDDAVLGAALRHFAAHGLAAAPRARGAAETALQAGDEAEYRHWLEICRVLDRRLARAVEGKAHHRKRAAGAGQQGVPLVNRSVTTSG